MVELVNSSMFAFNTLPVSKGNDDNDIGAGSFNDLLDVETKSLATKDVLSQVDASTSLVTDALTAKVYRPDMKHFMDATGLNAADASEILYGVVGSNVDTRNWSAIMASDDPVSMARKATGEMYNVGYSYNLDAYNVDKVGSGKVAQSGNFVLQQQFDGDGKVTSQGLRLIDGQGNLLRDAGNDELQIKRNAWLFGFDTAPLQALIEPAQLISQDLSDAINQVVKNDEIFTEVKVQHESSGALSEASDLLDSEGELFNQALALVSAQLNLERSIE
ncbi:hypothetical protein [Thiosulfativibrio zosterae]|uniref:Uncharacterized protein n=1 Tax=Thiosulfativibrio zosterae TaxID=2675053 RepID=A0A6F8PQ98_9GAMM|nr:hypothetical protein [Thiosulfativibrio zosterae]BBP44289.1 hypothetical protein THMIRHAT_20350 [Thiosulfativibrio zosterae]